MNRAPEMLDMHRGHRIDVAVDVWALGCLLFSLAYRKHPFDSESPLQVPPRPHPRAIPCPDRDPHPPCPRSISYPLAARQILNCNYTIPDDAPYSVALSRLVVAMLEPDPAQRPTVFQVTERASLLYAEKMAEEETEPAPSLPGMDEGGAEGGRGGGGPPEAPRVARSLASAAAAQARADSFENLMQAPA